MSWMRSVNEVILIWWVANDPVTKHSQNWQSLSVFNLWTRRTWLNKDWEQNEDVQYHKIASWWPMSKKVSNMISKWKKVYIRWYLHNRKVDVEGEDKLKIITEVVISDLLVLSSKNDVYSDDVDLSDDQLLNE